MPVLQIAAVPLPSCQHGKNLIFLFESLLQIFIFMVFMKGEENKC